MESGFTPLYPFWKKNDMGGIGAALPEPLGASSPASSHSRCKRPGQTGYWSRWFLELQTCPPDSLPKATHGVPFCSSLRPPFSRRVPLERRRKEGNGQGSLPPPRVPQTLAQRPWLQASQYGGGAERQPGRRMTFRGPQRRAPGPSLPRAAPPVPPGLGGSRKFPSRCLVGPWWGGRQRGQVGRGSPSAEPAGSGDAHEAVVGRYPAGTALTGGEAGGPQWGAWEWVRGRQ